LNGQQLSLSDSIDIINKQIQFILSQQQ
jgi:hypothetical protein